MIHRIREHYRNPDENRINWKLVQKEYEDPIETYVLDCFDSIHDVLPNISMVGNQFITDVNSVDISSYDRTRSKKPKDQEQKYYQIKNSRVGELIMNFHVDDEFHGKPIELDYQVKELIPIPDEHGDMLLKGVNYTPQYQLTETSTYVTSTDLVMKSLMPNKVRKVPVTIRSNKGDTYTTHAFETYVMDSFVNLLLYYFADMSVFDALEYFNVGAYISVLPTETVEETGYRPECMYFPCGNDIMVEVNSEAFMTSEYIRNIAGTVIDCIGTNMTWDNILSPEKWTIRIGGTKKTAKPEAHKELGSRYRVLYNRMLDKSSRKTLRTTWHSKENIYNIFRWICQNYDALRRKDNLDILNKRLRCNQYYGFSVNTVISEHIKKFVNTSVNTEEALINKYKVFFSFRGNEVISKMHKSGLIKFNDLVNDLTFFQRLKVTMNGPNALGNKNARNIAARQRALHPSHIGILGLDVCSASDPGITNYINPLCQTDGLFFKNSPPEPEDGFYNVAAELGLIKGDGDVVQIDPILFNNSLELLDHVSVKLVQSDAANN